MNILVELEVPKSCYECPFAYMTEGVSHDYCKYVGYETDIEDFTGSRCNERPRWCPFNNTETLRVLGESSQCDPRYPELEDRAYVSLAACEESEDAAKQDYDTTMNLRKLTMANGAYVLVQKTISKVTDDIKYEELLVSDDVMDILNRLMEELKMDHEHYCSIEMTDAKSFVSETFDRTYIYSIHFNGDAKVMRFKED